MKRHPDKNKLKAIDFFCGAGGMTHGLSQAGIKVLAGIDIDERCKETYEKNNPESKFILTDVHDLTVKDLMKKTNIRRNDMSLIFVGCSPCQYWTKINTDTKRAEGSKDLLGEFQRFVEWFKPGYLIIENVPGLYGKRKENILSDFLDFLESESYTYDHGVINANRYGVPQTRRRYLLVATLNNDKIKLPEGEDRADLTVRNFIGVKNGFPSVSAGHRDETNFMHTVAGLSPKNRERMERTPKDGGTRLSWKDCPDLQLDTYLGKDDNFVDTYGRMYWDKPAPTITTRLHSISNGRFGHPEENRAISLREGATLQTFPKKFVFKGTSIATISRQIGNAVPPELAKRIGKVIKNKHNGRNFIG